MGRPLPAKVAGYSLHRKFKAHLCHDQPGKRPSTSGGQRPATARCGRRPRASVLFKAVKRALTKPSRVSFSPTAWPGEVEKWYNHAEGYYIQRGSSGTFVDVSGKRAKTSPLRAHIKKYLRGDYPSEVRSFLAKLEASHRMKPLSGAEFANAILSKRQRSAAKARAKGSYDTALAKWLFNDHNWVFLCNNKQAVHREFFTVPNKREMNDWPQHPKGIGRGDAAYLRRIKARLDHCKSKVLSNLTNLKTYQNKFNVGIFAGDKAAILLQWSSQQAVLMDKRKWQAILPVTREDSQLTTTLLPVAHLWEKPVTKIPKL